MTGGCFDLAFGRQSETIRRMDASITNGNGNGTASHPFRSAVLRGLGVLTPPLLTILIFLWIINTRRRSSSSR